MSHEYDYFFFRFQGILIPNGFWTYAAFQAQRWMNQLVTCDPESRKRDERFSFMFSFPLSSRRVCLVSLLPARLDILGYLHLLRYSSGCPGLLSHPGT